MSKVVVEVQNLSKKFKIYHNPWNRVWDWLIPGRKSYQEFWALKNINFQLMKGESLGIIGPNGAGKSTLLKILTGALWPTYGDYKINGKVVSLLELGTGFHPELTGIQNIFHSSSLLGIEPQVVKQKLEAIAEFSGLGDFLNQPIKTYSSGMYVRLAFSLFANLDPDVYIVDEALSVGDIFFQQKCFAKLQEMREKGVSIILVSHDPSHITQYCELAMMIDHGQVVASGAPSDVMELYQAQEYQKMNNQRQSFSILKSEKGLVYGNGKCDITTVEMIKTGERSSSTTFDINDPITIRIEVLPTAIVSDLNLNVGIQIKNRLGNIIYGTNTYWNDFDIKTNQNLETIAVQFHTQCLLGPGEYTLTVAVSESKRHVEEVYCWKDNVLQFTVRECSEPTFGGQIFLPLRIELDKGEKKDGVIS